MGNQLVGIAPSQIFPVEHYLTDLTDLQFECNLGSTRFLKVARGKSQEGLIVVKVFAIHDPTLPLSSYKQTIESIRIKLSDTVNCLAFQKTVLNDKAGYVMREYVKYSLYDRISTRPFLLHIEKKWIAFQILYALHQCHKVGVCHGDIKLENLLITSWHWVLLSDFASYKPTYLPDDNPADFSYFFDTSRRRTCYIAPERFVKSSSCNNDISQVLFADECIEKGELTPAMDIFSTGCALAELFSDGCLAPFDFSQLLAYRNDEYSPNKILEKLEDERIRTLISSMIQKNPLQRQNAETYLSQERGKLFPEYFYTFLQSYMLIFSTKDPILSPDEKIERLKKDIHNIIDIIINKNTESNNEDSTNNSSDTIKQIDNSTESNQQNSNYKEDPLILITSLVTSCIRGLHFPSSKQSALYILLEICKHTTSETILDRILPYIFYLIFDNFPRVRVDAIQVLTKCLQYVQNVPVNNTNVFPEYILPSLCFIVNDTSVIVRTSLAENIATLAEIALRFLEYTQLLSSLTSPISSSSSSSSIEPHPAKHSYENELATLHEMIQSIVSVLLTDSHSIVKQTLIENDAITKLCIFFGKQKANDYLFSHMITFLNDKYNTQLRASFFDNIVGVAAYIGIHSSSMITPLLLQGFVDDEEFIVRKAINAMTSLTQLNLLEKTCLYELLNETSCLLIHPNLWIRHSMVSFLSSLSSCKHLNIVDIQCKLLPLIKPYLKYSIIQFDKPVILLSSLKQPISRNIYNTVCKYIHNDLFLYTLVQRFKSKQQQQQKNQQQQQQTVAINIDNIIQLIDHLNIDVLSNNNQNTIKITNLFRKLTSEGMTEDVEEYILLMAKHMKKVNKNLNNSDILDGDNGTICLRSVQSHNVTLTDHYHKGGDMKKTDSESNMNDEWKHMFSVRLKSNELRTNNLLYSDTSSSDISTSDVINIGNSMQERSFIQYHYAPCKIELRKLINRQQELHNVNNKSRDMNETFTWSSNIPPQKWRLRSILVAHLHEHKGGVTRIVNIPTTTLVASTSWDSTVKLWDLSKLEGKNVANRSKCQHNTHSNVINSITVCEHNKSLAISNCISNNKGIITVLKIDNGGKMSTICSRNIESSPSDLGTFDENVVVYSTITGQIFGWDLRMSNGIVWTFDNDLKKGAIFAMNVDSRQYNLVVGTSLGSYTCWDLRFRLPVSTFSHPHGIRVRKIIRHPNEPSCIISSMHGNNEVSIWNIESGIRQATFWASNAPPLSATSTNNHSVCGLYASTVKKNSFLLAAGSDQRIRYWGLENPNESYLAIPSGFEFNNPPTLTYEYNLIDGIKTCQEISIRTERTVQSSRSGTQTGEDTPRAGPEQCVPGHFDIVTDLTLGQASQCLLVTGSNDGVIKVWK